MTSSFSFLDSSDPRLKLTVENRVRNIFVTQSEDSRHRAEENVNHIPVVTEASGRVLEAGVNTLQRTLVLKKQAELDEVNRHLALRRREFKSRVEALAQRRSELEIKQQQTKERVTKFEKFVVETDMKQQQALKKYEVVLEQNNSKQRDIENLTQQLKRLRTRQQVLKDRMNKYKIYEDYLVKTLDYLPRNNLDNESETIVMPIIRRHETLSITHQDLLRRLEHREVEVEDKQQQLQTMKQEHSIKKLMANKEMSELQSQLESLKEKNKQTEANLLMEQAQSREKVKEVGTILMAINNLADQCYLPKYGPLENMNILTMMDMVKECILDKADTEKRARRLMESGSAMTSKTALTDKRRRESMKYISSKTQLKSPSKVSRKSDTFS